MSVIDVFFFKDNTSTQKSQDGNLLVMGLEIQKHISINTGQMAVCYYIRITSHGSPSQIRIQCRLMLNLGHESKITDTFLKLIHFGPPSEACLALPLLRRHHKVCKNYRNKKA